MTRLVACLLVAAGLALPGTADAEQRCRVQAQALLFGDYTAGTESPVDSTSRVAVRCVGSPASPFVVKLGTGTSGDPGNREMRAGAESLSYNLYVDASRTTVWGDGTRGSETVAVTAASDRGARPREADLAVYGRIHARQDPAPGLYTDAIVVTVEF